MSPNSKRRYFFSLLLIFLIYTAIVATSGTSNDMGKDFFTKGASEGKMHFQKYNCISCHQIYGLGGYMGPDLTNVISAKGKGIDYARAFLESGTQRMPDFNLSAREIDELLEYLVYVDKTGISPVTDFMVNKDGTISPAHQ